MAKTAEEYLLLPKKELCKLANVEESTKKTKSDLVKIILEKKKTAQHEEKSFRDE
jgi:hypothetical protein